MRRDRQRKEVTDSEDSSEENEVEEKASKEEDDHAAEETVETKVEMDSAKKKKFQRKMNELKSAVEGYRSY